MVRQSPLESEQPVLVGRRERKKRATRIALKAAAIDLIGERGLANVTVEDIADSVDVSVRTFFNHFDSKEAALVGDDPELIEAMRRSLLDLPPEVGPLDALRTIIVGRIQALSEDIDFLGEDRRVWLRRFAVVRAQPEVLLAYVKHLAVIERVLIEALVERLDGGEGSRAFAALVTACAMSVMRVAGMCWAGEGGTDSLVEFATAAFDILAQGLAIDPATASLTLAESLPELSTGAPGALAAPGSVT